MSVYRLNSTRPGLLPQGSVLLAVQRSGVLCGEVIGDDIGDVAERVELLGDEQVGEAVPDGVGVSRRRGIDGGLAGVGEEDVEAARIVMARRSFDRAAGFHAGDLVGEPAAFPAQPPAQVPGADPLAGSLGDGHEDGVVGLGEPALLAELAGQVRGELDAQALETAPGPLLALVEPPGFHKVSIPLVDTST